MTTFALLASPLLGPAVWRPVAEALRADGHGAAVLAASPGSGTPEEVLRDLLDACPPADDLVLVPHSNAGAYAAALAARLDVGAVVLVDAVLPPPAGVVPLAPPSLLDLLRGLADGEGRLPPWTRWWPEADLAPLFPDAACRRRVEAEEPRLPLAYFEGSLPAPPGWEPVRRAYLAFGATYAAERAQAEARGWRTRTLTGTHLHPLHDAEGVADAIVDLL